MNEADVLDIGRQAIFTLVMTILPVMGVALVVGLLISLFQALTQIQEMTLTFAPKLVAVFLTVALALPYMLSNLIELAQSLVARIPQLS
ncbi:MAG: flagellar biosynthetic protein FliQ [Rhodospirillaceae bacterium]|nr:flagellar biosynthetic protein FliQ [Rhodospirillaceae bacterium]|tara:strand:+ start:66 stop:332 length:267 start_codon:yes stop_codon:yes gene_type:complete